MCSLAMLKVKWILCCIVNDQLYTRDYANTSNTEKRSCKCWFTADRVTVSYQLKVLLVSSKKKDCISWLVPGGGVEAGEEISEAAMREAWEEAGVQGSIDRYLGLFETQHHSGRKRHRTAVFVVRVKEIQAQYPEAHLGRQREWFSLEEALLLLSRYRPLQSAYLQLMLVSQLKVPPAWIFTVSRQWEASAVCQGHLLSFARQAECQWHWRFPSAFRKDTDKKVKTVPE